MKQQLQPTHISSFTILFLLLISNLSQSLLLKKQQTQLQDTQQLYHKLTLCQPKKFINKNFIMCPKFYSPVCAVYTTKAKQEQNKINTEFSNSCWACLDEDIYGWIQGKCQSGQVINKCEKDGENKEIEQKYLESLGLHQIQVCGFEKGAKTFQQFDNYSQACSQKGIQYTIQGSCEDLVPNNTNDKNDNISSQQEDEEQEYQEQSVNEQEQEVADYNEDDDELI